MLQRSEGLSRARDPSVYTSHDYTQTENEPRTMRSFAFKRLDTDTINQVDICRAEHQLLREREASDGFSR